MRQVVLTLTLIVSLCMLDACGNSNSCAPVGGLDASTLPDAAAIDAGVTDAATNDAAATSDAAMTDGAMSDASSALTCNAALSCYSACFGSAACVDSCTARETSTARALDNDLFSGCPARACGPATDAGTGGDAGAADAGSPDAAAPACTANEVAMEVANGATANVSASCQNCMSNIDVFSVCHSELTACMADR
jgi:hypothetical protein